MALDDPRRQGSPHPYTTEELRRDDEAVERGQPYFRYRDGGRDFHTYSLDPARAPLDVGRAEGNDFRISWDELVSNRHAQLRYGAGVWSISDSGSSNGTRLNRRPVIREHPLHHCDEVRFGATEASFQNPHDPTIRTRTVPDEEKRLDVRNETQRRVLVELARPFFEWTAGRTRWPRAATNQVIADRTHLSPKTVRDYLSELYGQAGLERGRDDQREALADLAIEEGVVSEDDYPELS